MYKFQLLLWRYIIVLFCLCFVLAFPRRCSVAEILEKSEEKSAEHELSKEEQIALQGLPKLGEAINCVIHIRESKEFKVCSTRQS